VYDISIKLTAPSDRSVAVHSPYTGVTRYRVLIDWIRTVSRDRGRR